LLTNELTAIDQYLVQSRMLEHWGFLKLRDRIHHEADDERVHVDKLVKRILFLEGEPDVASRAKLKIGKSPKEMLANDLELELGVAKALNAAIGLCRKKADNGTREMLEELLGDTESDHIDWLEQQLHLIEELGLKSYLQEQL
jgi:bacterioferritin